MNSVIAVLSQIAWAITIGGLTAAVTLLAKILAVAGGLAGCGYLIWRLRKLGQH
jgi:hypothetical protein